MYPGNHSKKFSKIWPKTQLYHILDKHFENDL